jgi:hypothetical protein
MDQTPESVSYPVYTGMRTAGPAIVPWLGFVAAAIALPIFVLAGWSLWGWLLGTALFVLNRVAAILTDRLARGKMLVTAVGITGVSFISRAWVTFGFLVLFAIRVDKHIGVVAAVLFLALFTVDMVARSVAHVAGGGARREGTT